MEATAKKLLRTALDDPAAEFRDGQWECIEALLHKQRMLVVQRTGWGKSMVYFLVTRMLRDAGEGFTLLISPLLSLMRNQIQAAERIGIRAETINSTNLDGAFSVDRGTVPEGPVFLIDDMVDSRWTFSVIAALLRQAGCPAVFPLALAMNSPSGA